MLDFCSKFSHNAYFGGYPSKDEFYALIHDLQIEYFIDFTTLKERKNLSYNYEFDLVDFHNKKYLNFCILDNKIPTCTSSFLRLVAYVSDKIKNGASVYLHCKGGHGRSTLFVACVLIYIHSYDLHISLENTKIFHKNRKNLKEKYKDMEVPQCLCQRKYISDIHDKILNKHLI